MQIIYLWNRLPLAFASFHNTRELGKLDAVNGSRISVCCFQWKVKKKNTIHEKNKYNTQKRNIKLYFVIFLKIFKQIKRYYIENS